MRISDLAWQAGVGVETIRYYERRGLVDQPGRGPGGEIRRYGPGHLDRLRAIRRAKAAGFTLDEVAQLIALDRDNDRARARDMARARLAGIDEAMARLQAARQVLQRLEGACAASDSGPCPILEAFLD